MLLEKIVVSLDTEFIENEKEDVSKQDCEIAAAKHLLKRLAKNHTKLPICIQEDNLYAVEPVMKLCREKNGSIYSPIKNQDKNCKRKIMDGSGKGMGVSVSNG